MSHLDLSLRIELLDYTELIVTGLYSHNISRSLQLSKLHKTRALRGVSPSAQRFTALCENHYPSVNSTEAGDAHGAFLGSPPARPAAEAQKQTVSPLEDDEAAVSQLDETN